MNEFTFEGKITNIFEVNSGTTEKGEWASVEFEVTEVNEENPKYAQIAKFGFFKNGEYVKFAKDFKTYYKNGDLVKVSFNMKKNVYTKKDGTEGIFYKIDAWKVEKVNAEDTQEVELPEEDINPEDIPF
tara:strand:- start:568 stop:954 length:387 start_codon:yes stop_codon:yes gene_type:complete